MPKELDEKVTTADLQYERQARDRASSPRPSRRVLRGPRRRSASLLRYTVSKLPRLSVSAHDSWSSCVRCPMCLFLRPAGVETVVSEIDIIVSSTGSFNITVSNASVGNTGHFDNEIDFTGSEGWKV